MGAAALSDVADTILNQVVELVEPSVQGKLGFPTSPLVATSGLVGNPNFPCTEGSTNSTTWFRMVSATSESAAAPMEQC